MSPSYATNRPTWNPRRRADRAFLSRAPSIVRRSCAISPRPQASRRRKWRFLCGFCPCSADRSIRPIAMVLPTDARGRSDRAQRSTVPNRTSTATEGINERERPSRSTPAPQRWPWSMGPSRKRRVELSSTRAAGLPFRSRPLLVYARSVALPTRPARGEVRRDHVSRRARRRLARCHASANSADPIAIVTPVAIAAGTESVGPSSATRPTPAP